MNLSASNIGWTSDFDDEIYMFLSDNDFNGLEIAPTRIFPTAPYEQAKEAHLFALRLKNDHGLVISS